MKLMKDLFIIFKIKYIMDNYLMESSTATASKLILKIIQNTQVPSMKEKK